MTASIRSPLRVSTIILAGGAGRRVGGADKGLIQWKGRTLIEHVIDRVARQSDEVVISANRNLEQYRTLGYPIVSDEMPDLPGPLAGLVSAAPLCRHELIFVAPCDCPLLPLDIVARLADNLSEADVVVPFDGERIQYLCMLARTRIVPSIRTYLNAGERSIRGWLESQRYRLADFSGRADEFRNFNYLGNTEPTDEPNTAAGTE